MAKIPHIGTASDFYNFSEAEKFILNKLMEEVPSKLYYHGVHHTIDVFNAALKIAETEELSPEQLRLLRIAVLYHDAGFVEVYKEHEKYGCALAKEILPRFGFNDKEINIICKMIMATKIPQTPTSKLEKIICDADLDYLGREDFFKIANSLFKELKTHCLVSDKEEWNNIQEKFLEKHQYHTKFSKAEREPGKQQHLRQLKVKK